MARAVWNGSVIAESTETRDLEGNTYFPHESVLLEYFQDSTTTTICDWKGIAHYFHIVVEGKTNTDGAWYYPDPKPAADLIKGHVAFCRGVIIEV